MRQNTFNRIRLFNDPLLRVAVPLLYGMSRHTLMKQGAERHEVRLNNVTISYFQQAAAQPTRNAPPILLVHGIADNALTWSMVMPALARSYDVYALDLPGYGLSGTPLGRSYTSLDEMRDVLSAFIHKVIGRPALIVGNSMGGWIAVKLGRSEPQLMRGLMLLDSGGAPLAGRSSWEPFAELIAVRDMRSSRQILRYMFGRIPAPLLYFGQHGIQELFQRQVVRDFVASLLGGDAAEREFLQPEDLRKLGVPTALVWGLSDKFLPHGSLEFFRENLPGAPTLLLRHCGHLPQRERPIAVARFIRRFAEDVAARGAAAPAPKPGHYAPEAQ